MPTRSLFTSGYRPSLSFVLLIVLFAALWLAGGASRGDVLGQVVVRSVSFCILVVVAVLQQKLGFDRTKPVVWILLGVIVIALLQLVPLPPSIWQALPGRSPFAAVAGLLGQAQPWRPMAIVPDNTLNALISLVVPLTVAILLAGLEQRERDQLPALLLLMIATSTLIGLLQMSGVHVANPWINDSPGEVGGIFANRNHYALLLAIGCLLAPVWTFAGEGRAGWRAPVAFGLTLLFSLMILGTGSRSGLVLEFIALVIAMAIVWRPMLRQLRRAPRWVLPAAIAGGAVIFGIFILISVAADRAASIARVLQTDPGQDMRSRGLPVVLQMIREYFPFGTGLGNFDPIFRMHEPFNLLKPTYFNHAHNDFLEIVLDTGVAGLLLLGAGLGWWAVASVRAWRRQSRSTAAKLGSTVLLLVFLASIVDYPARTPTIMAVIVMAGFWLATQPPRTALPSQDQSL